MTFRTLAGGFWPAAARKLRAAWADDPPAQPVDADYTAKIREYTTEPFFLTELVDHLPSSDTVPSPKKALGYVVGTPEKLTYTKDLNAYFRALAAASPRVKVWTIGKSEGGREMLLAAVSSEENLARIDHYKQITAKLADPRKTTDTETAATGARGQTVLLALRVDPFAGDRLARDAHGAGLPARRRRLGTRPGDPQKPDRADHACRGGRRPRPNARRLSLSQGKPGQAGAGVGVLGQICSPRQQP